MHVDDVPSRPAHLQLLTSAAEKPRTRVYAVTIIRLIGALALLATGYIHIEQYYVADYRVIPTIGTLFLLNFIGGTILGLYLLVPNRGGVGRGRWLLDSLAALSGWGLAAISLVALEISEHTPLFGFMEHGYRSAIVFAVVAEGVVVVALGIFLGLSYRRRPRQPVLVAPSIDRRSDPGSRR